MRNYEIKLVSHRNFFLRNANDERATSLDNINPEATIGKSPARNYRARPQSLNLRTRLATLSPMLWLTTIFVARYYTSHESAMSLSGRSLVTEDRPGKPRKIEEDILSLLYESVESTKSDCNIATLIQELE